MIAALLLAATAAAPQAPAPKPGDLKTFADWTVGCDNGARCQAVALVPESDDRDAYLLLVLKRDGDGAAQATLTMPASARLIGKDATTCDDAGPVEPEAHRLDAGHTLVLVPHPCGNGAYNAFTSVYVIDEAGRVDAAAFDTPVGMAEDVTNELTNGSWDAATRRLSDYVKARGVGDCGGSSAFAWDGARFRLVEATGMGECRGSIDWITTWRASVTTR